MVAIHIKGHINEQGKLEVELPAGIAPGAVDVTIEIPASSHLPWELQPWTQTELADLMRIEPKSGAEIVALLEQEGGWEDADIADGAAWVEEQRRKRERGLPRW